MLLFFIPYRVGFLIIYHFLQINVPIGYKFSLVKSSVLKINVKNFKKNVKKVCQNKNSFYICV